MADIELVIKISEDDYDWIKREEGNIGYPRTLRVYKAIANSTPLPDGCGRLIDADKYKRMWVDTFDSCYGDACAKLFKDSVDNAPTIIEADNR